jgi:hypothetical protein
MSINKLLPVRDAIFNACEDMGVDTTGQIPTLTRWAVDAEKKIGSYYGWVKKRAVLDVVGCKAKLPCGAMKVQYALVGDHGCDCTELISNLNAWAMTFRPAANETFLIVDTIDSNNFQCYGNRWEVQDNSIVFQNNLDGQKVTIQYLGYQEDKNGFIMVNENHVMPIVSYIKWKFAERSRYSPIKMDHTDIAYLKNQWKEERAEAVAADSELSETERAEIVSMLHDPYIGFGLELGMH